ncbi:MAG: SH3 domain-containing protein [Thermomicrobiales bacterium]|nr:SH3 domain-containing protein [Thermomicrobiales bacterium]
MNGLRTRISMVVVATMLMIAVAGIAGVAPVSAQFGNGDVVVVVNGSLNLRQDPGLTGTILQTLPQGTPLTVTGDAQTVDAIEWYPVITAGAVAGFVAGQYIELQGDGEFAVGDHIMVANGPLNLRSAPGTGSSILKKLPTGAMGTVLAGPTVANSMDWYQIQAGSDAGWVAGDYLDLATSPVGEFEAGDEIYVADGPLNLRSEAGTSGTILKTLPTGTTGTVLAGPTVANGRDWYQIEAGSDVGWVAGDYLALDSGSPTGDFDINSYVFVNVPKLNLRASASADAAVLVTMTQGTMGKVIGGPTASGSYVWYQLDVNGTQGWAVGEYLVGGIVVGETAVVADGPINLRVSASSSSQSLGPIPQGATVTITSGPTAGGSYSWFGATHNGQNGYVAGQFLSGS